jgi:hypothetical protein
MLEMLKSFSSVGRADTEDLISLSAYGRQLEAEFTALSVEVPEWVTNQLKALRREIKSRNADALANKLRSAKARLETLKTPDEKRTALADEIAKLEQQIAEA